MVVKTFENPNKELSNFELISKAALLHSVNHGFSNTFLNWAEKMHKTPGDNLTKDFCRMAFRMTAIKLYFGGVGEKETFQTGVKLLKKQDIGVIVDFCGAEGDKELSKESLAAVNKNYNSSLQICENLADAVKNTLKAKNRISAAIKVSNFAEYEHLEKISQELAKMRSEQPDISIPDAINNLSTESREVYGRYRSDVFDKLNKAKKKGFTAFIDAEQEAINPAIELVAKDALLNGLPLNYTLQTYLTNAHEKQEEWAKFAEQRVEVDRVQTQIKDILGFKIVRGAYMDPDRDERRKYAKEHSEAEALIKFPIDKKFEKDENIWPEKELTDKAYNKSFQDMFTIGYCQITLATMNQKSLDLAEEHFTKNRYKNEKTEVDAAYLRGMRGNLRIPEKFRRSEYLPWVAKGGELDAAAYSARRGTEQLTSMVEMSDGRIIKRGEMEMELVMDEMKRRKIPDLTRVFDHLNSYAAKAIEKSMQRA
ncbi:MAG TPA: hypothetical protein DIV86_03780 [Alphaproteobacteria bacterium]|nr:hypothetical protein [Alphaproteobacteria bacterium]